MKTKKGAAATRGHGPVAKPPAATPAPPWAPYAGALTAAVVALLWVYAPVMHTGFVFDDTKQRFALPSASDPLLSWILSPVRPLLMFTYWVNVQISRDDTLSYHWLNLAIHALAAALVFLAFRRLLEWAGTGERPRTMLAAFGALVFLLHPLQTESVAYIAGRSEALSGMLAAAAFVVFLYRRSTAISWSGAAAVVLLFGAAILSKEQAVVLPAVLLLTDFWWNPGFSLEGALGNWRLYAPLAAGAAAGVAFFWKLILGVGTGGSAGFSMKDLPWYQYLFTQFRAFFVYLGNFVFPVNLNLDWEFPISRSIVDHGAVFGLAALVALAAAAWHYRYRFRLAAYGFFLWLVLLLPTSSILPIKDPVADRRMYLPMIGLILIAIDLLSRLRIDRKMLAAVCAAIVIVEAAVTHARAELWSDPVSLWEDTVAKSPGKSRPHFQLAMAYYEQGTFDRAVAEFEKSAAIEKPDFDLLVDWGLAYDGLHQPEKALAKLRQAAALEPNAHVYTQIGKVYADQKQWKQAMENFELAERLDPRFPATFAYKGLVHLANNDPAGGMLECRRALTIDPSFQPALQCVSMAQQMSGR